MTDVIITYQSCTGTICLAPLGRIYIQSIYTPPEDRGKGYASQLLKNIIEMGAKNGYTVIYVDDMSEAPVDKNIYQKLGFEIQARTNSGRNIWVPWKKTSLLMGPERRLLVTKK